jgi:hypothetical protein
VLDWHDDVQPNLLQPLERPPSSLVVLRRQRAHQDGVDGGDVLERHADRELATELRVQLLRLLQLSERDRADYGPISASAREGIRVLPALVL